MFPTMTTLLKSVTGKAVIGLTVATMSVGAAAAAGAEVPVLTDALSAPSSDDDPQGEGSTADDSTDEELTAESSEESTDESSDESNEESGDESNDDAAESDQDHGAESGDEDDVANHGAVVSDFTQGTDLTGCAKGQATAAVARGDVDPTALTDDQLATELAPYIAKCGDEDDSAEGDDDDSDEGDDDGDWKDVRDDAKAQWHEAKAAFEAACGDDDADDADDADDDEVEEVDDDSDSDSDSADDDLSPECRAMKAELKQLHEAGKAEWKQARDAAKAERKESRDDAKAERKEGRDDAKAERKAERSNDNSDKSNNGKGQGKKDG